MNSLVNVITFAVATFVEATWRCEIFEKQDVGQRRNSLSNLKIVVRIWNSIAAGWCVEYIRQQKHTQEQSNKCISGRHSEVLLLSHLILLWPTSQFMLPEMSKEHSKYAITLWSLSNVPKNSGWVEVLLQLAGTCDHVTYVPEYWW